MKQKQHFQEATFLATTALEEFWDTAMPMLFLGEWCLLHERRHFWEPLGGRLLESPYEVDGAAISAYHALDQIYEQTLPLLGEAMNAIHGCSHNTRFWRIIMGPWLNYYLSITYDKYLHVREAFEKYPNLTTVVLSEESFVTPSNTLDFVCYMLEDSFNLQIYTRIIAALGKSFPSRPTKIAQSQLFERMTRTSWKHRVLNFAAKICMQVGGAIGRPVIVKDAYFSKSAELQLMAQLPLRILPDWGIPAVQPAIAYNLELRESLVDVFTGTSEYEKCLADMFRRDIPLCFLEGFKLATETGGRNYPKAAKAILSANAWYYNEPFKFWAANATEEGALLLGTQHGGNYGSLACMPSENHETAISDLYYSWGWQRNDCRAEVIPMPATKLIGRRKMGADNRKLGILWVATSAHRYLLQFPVLPQAFSDYLSWQTRFVRTLTPDIQETILLRPHYQDYGWSIVFRLKEVISDIRIEGWEVPFLGSLENCRLYVCDHLSTTFVEALAAGKPSILFWDPLSNKERKEAKPYYDLLRRNGILFDTPEQAGEAINTIYGDVESWWNEPERQAAVRTFCERFAKNSADAVGLWAQELERIIKAPISSSQYSR